MFNLKKKNALFIALWFLSPHLLAAGENLNGDPDGWSKALSDATTQPTQVITPIMAPPVVPGEANVTTFADFLWWKSYLDGVEFAWSGGIYNSSRGTLGVGEGNLKTPPFKFAPGVKVGIGVISDFDGWDGFAVYTGLYTGHHHNKTLFDSTKGLNGTFLTPTNRNLNEVTCSSKQSFNVLDLTLGRNFFISKVLTLRPNVGIKLSWIEEKFNINYDLPFATFVPLNVTQQVQNFSPFEQQFPNFGLPNFTEDFTLNQRQYGIGARGGLNAVWHFTKEYGIYGDFAASVMWNNFKIKSLETALRPTLVSNQFGAEVVFNVYNLLNQKTSIRRISSVLEVGLGFEGMVWFNNDKWLLTTRLGWEGQIWMNFNQLYAPLLNDYSFDYPAKLVGDLSLHGLTARVGFTF